MFEKERLQVDAWAIGGIEAEKEERQRQFDEEKTKNDKNFEAMRLMQERARAKRVETYGEDSEPEFSEELERFRDEQLKKVEGVDSGRFPSIRQSNVEGVDEERFPAVRQNNNHQETPKINDAAQGIAVVNPLLGRKPLIQEMTEEVADVEEKKLIEEVNDLTIEDDEFVHGYQRPSEQKEVEKELVHEHYYKNDDIENVSMPLLASDTRIDGKFFFIKSNLFKR